MRARNIKPGFYKNEQLAECSFEARLLFPGLWMIADRKGRMEYRPKRIKAEIFPFDNMDIPQLISELEKEGLISMYEVEGCKYLWIPGFAKHQVPHCKEKQSEIPPHPNDNNPGQDQGESSARPGQDQCEPGNFECQHPLNPESLNLNPESIPPPSTRVRARGERGGEPANPDEPFLMAPDWYPSEYFATLAETSGLHPPSPDELEPALREFQAYWLTQKRKRTAHEWDLAFVKAIQSGFNQNRSRDKPKKHQGKANNGRDFSDIDYQVGATRDEDLPDFLREPPPRKGEQATAP